MSELVVRGRVVTPGAVVDDGAVVVAGDRIVWVGPVAEVPRAHSAAVASTPVPPAGTTVLPGLVDLHDHGGGGASFPDATTPGDARRAVREHLRHGTTALVASLVTADPATLLTRTALLADLADAGEIVGIHLEGPFLSVARCGAQNPADMLSGDPDLVRAVALAARGHLVTMTVAPEVDGVRGAGGVVDTLAEVGAVPSFGHTDADSGTVDDAVRQARRALARTGSRSARPTATHLFNGMRPLHHRDPGPVAACLAAAARGSSSSSWSRTAPTSPPARCGRCSTSWGRTRSRSSPTRWPRPGCRTAATSSGRCTSSSRTVSPGSRTAARSPAAPRTCSTSSVRPCGPVSRSSTPYGRPR
ncbi:amidohydrolase family protein [Cellulomonas sp. ATA003]|nr:amidohydrolase family protein [Cellulomonas sp. ATA003]WNB84948.1 amidohydrolase family protein [Cellulomonas sp. ATA003]